MVFKKGEIVIRDGVKYVIVGSYDQEWVGTEYDVVKLDTIISIGDFIDDDKPAHHGGMKRLTVRELKENPFVKDETEAPFELTRKTVELYSCRRKKAKTITVYE